MAHLPDEFRRAGPEQIEEFALQGNIATGLSGKMRQIERHEGILC